MEQGLGKAPLWVNREEPSGGENNRFLRSARLTAAASWGSGKAKDAKLGKGIE